MFKFGNEEEAADVPLFLLVPLERPEEDELELLVVEDEDEEVEAFEDEEVAAWEYMTSMVKPRRVRRVLFMSFININFNFVINCYLLGFYSFL